MDHECRWTYDGSIPAGMVPAHERAGMPDCDQPTVLRCDDCGDTSEGRRLVACSSTRASACRPCAKRYRGRVAVVARSGRRGGREGLFVTLTATGDNRHRVSKDAGAAWCECTPEDGTDLAVWNATSGEKWRRIIQWIRRNYGADVEYFRATEAQKRGALHFHVIFRRRDGGALVIDVGELREAAIRNGFGHEVDVQPLEHVKTKPSKAHGGKRAKVGNVYAYVAKYVSKAADQRGRVPWAAPPANPQGPALDNKGRLDLDPAPARATYRTWVASRQWGDSMRAVRDAQAHNAIIVTHHLGYDDGDLDAIPTRPDLLAIRAAVEKAEAKQRARDLAGVTS